MPIRRPPRPRLRQLDPRRGVAAWAWACGAASLMVAVGCQRTAGPDDRVRLQVFAASSLREAFADAENAFEAMHPEVDVVCNFAGSQVLRTHIEQGAAVDVFASADSAQVEALRDRGLVGPPTSFARNSLVVVVPPDNPAQIRSFADLATARRIVLGGPTVPIGVYTLQLLANAEARLGGAFVAAVRGHVVSEESNVRLVRAKVELGEADAAIVYRSDATAAPSLGVVAVPPELDVAATYSVAIGSQSRHSEWARRWVALLRSAELRAVLRARGLLPVD